MPPVLKGKAGQIILVLEEDALWDPVIHNLEDGAVDQDGPHEPFEEYSVAYLTAFVERGGDVMFRLGPVGEPGYEGTTELDAEGGLIVCLLPRAATVALPLPGPRYAGWYKVDLDPGGDADRRVRYLEGDLLLSRGDSEEVS